MLSERPWKPEVVLRFFAGIFAAYCLVFLVVNAYHSLTAQTLDNREPSLAVLFGTFAFHVLALVLVHVFLREHRMSWSQGFGFREPRLQRTILLSVVLALLVLPIALSLTEVSFWLLRTLKLTVETQNVVQGLQKSHGGLEKVYYAVAALITAPLVEELIFRGIMYPGIKQLGYPKLALWGSASFFALIHWNLAYVLPLIFLAVMLTLLYETTNNLMAPILTHALFNAANYAAILLGWTKPG
jgi:membrane protease YdiL (CAAX protease family)